MVELAAAADVVVDNFRRGALERRGIDSRATSSRETSDSYGAQSRDSANEVRASATTSSSRQKVGWMAITGNPDGDPMRVGVALADIIAGKDATIAILAALVAAISTLSRRSDLAAFTYRLRTARLPR